MQNQKQTISPNKIPVTIDNFIRAETDWQFHALAINQNGFGRFVHRELIPIERQTSLHSNRDVFASRAIFDLDAGPVTITLPNVDTRFISMQIIDQDHYNYAVFYDYGEYTLYREKIGTRYVMVNINIQVDAANPRDIKLVKKYQEAISFKQLSRGSFEIHNWDQISQQRIRDALILLGETIPDSRGMFGTWDEVDPIRHLIGTAMEWGGKPEDDVMYFNYIPKKNDGMSIYRLTVCDVPVDGFWSICIYNSKGFIEPNEFNIYSISSLTAQKEMDGSITVQFGGYDGKTANCLPIMSGWHYLVRLYRPRFRVLNGIWKFPEAQLISESTVTQQKQRLRSVEGKLFQPR